MYVREACRLFYFILFSMSFHLEVILLVHDKTLFMVLIFPFVTLVSSVLSFFWCKSCHNFQNHVLKQRILVLA
jgi:hypothetical protein